MRQKRNCLSAIFFQWASCNHHAKQKASPLLFHRQSCFYTSSHHRNLPPTLTTDRRNLPNLVTSTSTSAAEHQKSEDVERGTSSTSRLSLHHDVKEGSDGEGGMVCPALPQRIVTSLDALPPSFSSSITVKGKMNASAGGGNKKSSPTTAAAVAEGGAEHPTAPPTRAVDWSVQDFHHYQSVYKYNEQGMVTDVVGETSLTKPAGYLVEQDDKNYTLLRQRDPWITEQTVQAMRDYYAKTKQRGRRVGTSYQRPTTMGLLQGHFSGFLNFPPADQTRREQQQRQQRDSRASSSSSGLRLRRIRSANFEWLDITSPAASTLQDFRHSATMVLVDLGVPILIVETIEEAVLLPQATSTEDYVGIVIRVAIDAPTIEMDSIQELTNRLTVIISRKHQQIITLHKGKVQLVDNIREDWHTYYKDISISHFVNLVLKRATKSFQNALAFSLVSFDRFEASLFVPQHQRSDLARQIYHVKRQAAVFSRVLSLIGDAYTQGSGFLNVSENSIHYQDVLQHITYIRNMSEELNDNASNVLQLLFQLTSYQVNEFMRILTMFSAFFIPLGFVTGFYGMNFADLPGLKMEGGHWYCLGTMAMMSMVLMRWFQRKGFW